MFVKSVIAAAVFAVATGAALAQPRDPAATPGVDHRQQHQQ
ncbi:MAG: hypothetical protein ACK59Y_16070 [Betaproteobacteria bacterium]